MYNNWTKFNGGTIPEGYEVRSFCHCGLMIRKIQTEKLLTIDELCKASKLFKKNKHKYHENKDSYNNRCR
jgi:hypothetical protein